MAPISAGTDKGLREVIGPIDHRPRPGFNQGLVGATGQHRKDPAAGKGRKSNGRSCECAGSGGVGIAVASSFCRGDQDLLDPVTACEMAEGISEGDENPSLRATVKDLRPEAGNAIIEAVGNLLCRAVGAGHFKHGGAVAGPQPLRNGGGKDTTCIDTDRMRMGQSRIAAARAIGDARIAGPYADKRTTHERPVGLTVRAGRAAGRGDLASFFSAPGRYRGPGRGVPVIKGRATHPRATDGGDRLPAMAPGLKKGASKGNRQVHCHPSPDRQGCPGVRRPRGHASLKGSAGAHRSPAQTLPRHPDCRRPPGRRDSLWRGPARRRSASQARRAAPMHVAIAVAGVHHLTARLIDKHTAGTAEQGMAGSVVHASRCAHREGRDTVASRHPGQPVCNARRRDKACRREVHEDTGEVIFDLDIDRRPCHRHHVVPRIDVPPHQHVCGIKDHLDDRRRRDEISMGIRRRLPAVRAQTADCLASPRGRRYVRIMNRFDGKVALVTGAASGIGRATMERLAREGANVIAVDQETGTLNEAVSRLKAGGANVIAVVADVMDESAIEAAFATLDDMTAGQLDVSIHIAGNSMFGTIEGLASGDWERLWRLNVLSTVICCRLAVLRMKATGGGAIVNMSSISGLAGDPGWGAYNSAKAAIWNLTQCLAWEVGRHNIRANAICPGPIGTKRMLGSLQTAPEQARAYAQSTPLGRIGTPEECAAAICFLASDDASFVNSTMLVCDGGLTGATGQPRFDMDFYSFGG